MIKTEETMEYTGFIQFPRKHCGPDFVEALVDGRLQYDIKDTAEE